MGTGEASVGQRGTRSGAGFRKGRRRPRWGAALLLALCASALPAAPAFGEGSVDFNTGADNIRRNALRMAPSQYAVLRVYARAGETIQMGSSAMQLAGGQDNILVYAPGTAFASSTNPSVPATLPTDPVFASDVFDCNTNDPGTGRIASRAEELAGPAPNPGGYNACEFTAPADGIYPIVMMPWIPSPNPTVGQTIGNPLTTTSQGGTVSIWDVTVRDAGVVQPGRLFSHRLSFWERTVGFPIPAPTSSPTSYLYTPAGYTYRVRFFSHAGEAWELAADARGVVDAATGERTFASFQWGIDNNQNIPAHFEAIAPQITGPDTALDSKYPLFVRPPDPVVISGNEGLGELRGFAAAPISPSSALADLSFAGTGGEQGATAQGSGGTIRFDSPPQTDGLGYTVAIDLNQNGSFGDANDVIDDTGDLDSTGQNSFTWSGQDAAGATPACGNYGYQVRSTLAEVHLTMSDVESSGGTQIERLSLPGDPALGDPFAASYNDVDLYKGTAVTNASPSAVNAGTSGPGFHAWSGATGNVDFVDTWMRLPEVSASGTLQVQCASPPPPAPGEVSVDKRASDGRVVVGDTVRYRLVAKNNSAGQADGVVVEDRVPSRLDVRGASSTQGDCSVSGNRVRCEIGALAVGQQATVTIRAVAIKAGRSTNTGVVIAEPCPAGRCDTDPAKVTIVKPKLRVSKTATKARVRAGNTLAYAIRVRNPSKRPVRNVRTCDHLPAGLVPVSTTAKAKVSKGRYCWTAKRLGAGKSKTYNLTVRALPGAAGRTINRATARSRGVRGTARAARAVRVLANQGAGGGVTG